MNEIREALSNLWGISRNTVLEEIEKRLIEWEEAHTTSKDRYQLLLDIRKMLKEMKA